MSLCSQHTHVDCTGEGWNGPLSDCLYAHNEHVHVVIRNTGMGAEITIYTIINGISCMMAFAAPSSLYGNARSFIFTFT